MSTIIKASEVAPSIYEILVESVEKEFEGESETVKQEALFSILKAIS